MKISIKTNYCKKCGWETRHEVKKIFLIAKKEL